MLQRPIAGRKQGGSRFEMLCKLGATGSLHQFPMVPGSDDNRPAIVSHRRSMRLGLADFARLQSAEWCDAAAIGLGFKFQSLPEPFDGPVVAAVERERRLGKVADQPSGRVRAATVDIDRLTAGVLLHAQVAEREPIARLSLWSEHMADSGSLPGRQFGALGR